jgi:hypothetical protein
MELYKIGWLKLLNEDNKIEKNESNNNNPLLLDVDKQRDTFRNYYVNLALPTITFSSPLAPKSIKIF